MALPLIAPSADCHPAYAEGWKAAEAGLDASANPYQWGDAAWFSEWGCGFHDFAAVTKAPTLTEALTAAGFRSEPSNLPGKRVIIRARDGLRLEPMDAAEAWAFLARGDAQ